MKEPPRIDPTEHHALTIPQIARKFGWTRRRMFRYLIWANANMGGTLLFNASLGGRKPRWMVTVAALKNLLPQFHNDPEQRQLEMEFLRAEAEKREITVDEMRAEMTTLKRKVEMIIEKIVAEGGAVTR